LRFGSPWFAGVAGVLVLAAIVGEGLEGGRPIGWGWAVILFLLAAPYAVIALAARRVNKAVRGRRAVRLCCWVVVGLGGTVALLPLYDVSR
jgi:uncharacterized membrane protein